MTKPALIVHFESSVLALSNQLSKLLRFRYGLWILGTISFLESALLLPIVTDPFMVAYILAHRTKTVLAVCVTTATSLFGGFIAYITAAFFIDLILGFLSPASATSFSAMINEVQNGTFVIALLGAITPIPFTLAALAAGAIKGNLLLFLLGALIGRIIRYGAVGYLTFKFGEQAMIIAKRNIGLLSLLTVIACVIYLWLTTM